MCVVEFKPGQAKGYPRPVRNHCPCSCPLGFIRQGCGHLKNYPESAQGITQVTPEKEPAMKITESREPYAQLTRTVEIDDGPIHVHQYSNTGKKFQVTYVSIKYTLEDGEWVADGSMAVTLSGPVLKKDGTPGKETYRGHPDYDYNARAYRPQYQWVVDLAERLRPVGVPVLPPV